MWISDRKLCFKKDLFFNPFVERFPAIHNIFWFDFLLFKPIPKYYLWEIGDYWIEIERKSIKYKIDIKLKIINKQIIFQTYEKDCKNVNKQINGEIKNHSLITSGM